MGVSAEDLIGFAVAAIILGSMALVLLSFVGLLIWSVW